MHETDAEPNDDAEPNEEPEPNEDAGGPHLRDALGRIPWLAWIFVLFAVGELVWFLRGPDVVPNSSAADIVVYVLRITPAVASILLPAALLARHPDAPSRLRAILFGTILFAAVQGLAVLADPLQPIFESLTPASEELPFLVPLAAMYGALIGLIAAFGVAYVALGLSQARRFEDASGILPSLFVLAATVLATVGGVIAVAQLDLGGTPMSPPLAIFLGSSVVLGILRVAVWAYLAAVSTRGWRAGEEPSAGWLLTVLSTGLILLALALVNLNALISVQDPTIVTLYGYILSTAYALGHVCLLAAFAVGLPALDAIDEFEDEWFDDDEDEGFEDDGDEVFEDEAAEDDGGWPVVADPGR